MMAFVVINSIHLPHCCLLVAYVFLMLCMNSTVLSSASEVVPIHSNTTVVNRCIEREREALLDIKQGLVDGDGPLSSWGTNLDCCQWSGVGCENHTGHVTHLNLSRCLSNIRHSLLELKNLNYLDLSHNYFGQVPIPKFIGSLANLVYLDLSGAYFEGAIPDELGNLSKLNHLDLSFNFFDSGPIPKFIASFTSLTYLALSDFTGEIPVELGNLSKLNHLDLGDNFFDSGPIPKFIASFTSLTYLALSGSYFTGEIPVELGNLSKLNHLDLSSNFVLERGNLDWHFHLYSLTHLDLSGINIAAGSNWLKLIERLPLLSVLRLNGCNLNSTRLPFSYSVNSSFSISTLHLRGNQIDSSIFDLLSNFSGSLLDVDLSDNHLKGVTPNSFHNSSLHVLDLSSNFLTGNLQDLFNVLPVNTLQVLVVSYNQLTGSVPDITQFSSLKQFYASFNQLNGYLPKHFKNKRSLPGLDLSNNYLRGSLPSFMGFLNMEFLYLNNNKFSGSLPDFTGLQSLSYLNLAHNEFSGSLPDFTGLQSLSNLNLAHNEFSGSLPDFTGLQSLSYLNLAHNEFSGSLPDFTGLQSLINLNLAHNEFSGSLPDFSGCLSLNELWLQENQLTEWKTQSIGQLTDLYLLDLSMNLIGSTISEIHLFNLSNLEYLNTSFNLLTFNLSSEWLPPFQIVELLLRSCKLGPRFPNWIRNQAKIDTLDFSNGEISDTIPMWFWNVSSTMTMLNLSSNKLRGRVSSKPFDIDVIDLSSNYLEGPIPPIPSLCSKINLSQNRFSGTLFSLSVAKNISLSYLDLSHNLLSGALPDRWVYFQTLAFLNLGYNNLSGTIPTSMGHLVSLQTLILRNNNFLGELPVSLRNCGRLGFVDFGLNNLSGYIPPWIGEDLPLLYALILRSNKFYGTMPYELCHLSDLHFLDLSLNRISGTVPPCFSNFTAMNQKGTEKTEHYYNSTSRAYAPTATASYVDNALAFWKGRVFEYGRNFAYLKMIDLSANELTGEIPIGITRLLDLKGLNLSSNKFYGDVPLDIGRLKMLESLDLARNKFSGEIPQSMSGLNFLGYLDLSYNSLSGRIPSGTQLQGFNVSMYEGNVGLCGSPLEKLCPGDEADVEVEPSSNGKEAIDDEIEYKRWLYIGAALGFGTTFWGICGILVLNRRWRHAYFLFLNNLKDQIYVIVAIHVVRSRS